MIVPQNGAVNPMVQMPGVGGASNGNMPVTNAPSPINMLQPSSIAAGNPFVAPMSVGAGGVSGSPIPGGPNTGIVPITGAPTVNPLPPGSIQTSPVNWADTAFSATGDLKDTYGAGTGKAISSVLQNLGTTNDAAIQAMIANTNLEASKQYANIQAGLAASGITPDSSTAALTTGDFYSTVNSQLQTNIANMEQQQENTLLDTLMQTGQQHGPDVTGFQSAMDVIGSLGGIIPGGAQATSGIISAVNPGADTSILDAIGALG